MKGATASTTAAGWRRDTRRRRTERRLRGLLIQGFLVAISVPLLIPYSWLVARAFGLRDMLDIWWVTAVLLATVFGLWIWIVSAPDGRARIVGGVVICAAAGGALAFSVGGNTNLAQFDFLSRPRENPRVWQAFGNSLYLALSQTLIVVTVASLAGYYLSRFKFALRNTMMQALLVVHGVPVMTLIVPLFLMMHWAGLLDRLIGAMLVLVALELPFAVFVMKGFFDTLPWDIEMAAIIDGATRRQAFVRVILPQVSNGMVAVSVFTFVRGWEEFVFVSVFMVSSANWVMSLFLFFQNNAPAVALFYMLPPTLAFILTQKYLLRISVGGSG